MAVTLREDLRHMGVPEDEMPSRCLLFGEDHLLNFPVIKSGVWARLSPAGMNNTRGNLAYYVLYVFVLYFCINTYYQNTPLVLLDNTTSDPRSSVRPLPSES